MGNKRGGESLRVGVRMKEEGWGGERKYGRGCVRRGQWGGGGGRRYEKDIWRGRERMGGGGGGGGCGEEIWRERGMGSGRRERKVKEYMYLGVDHITWPMLSLYLRAHPHMLQIQQQDLPHR